MEETTQDQAPMEIHPDRLYTTEQVAEYLDLHRDTVYRIPRSLLRRTAVGPKGGRTKIMGRDLLAYLRGEKAVA